MKQNYQIMDIESLEEVVDTVSALFASDFPRRELYITLSRSYANCEDSDILEEELQKKLWNWLHKLYTEKGWVYWKRTSDGLNVLDKCKECIDHSTPLIDYDHFIVLYDPTARVPAVIVHKTVFELQQGAILGALAEVSYTTDEFYDITTVISPALYIEAYPEEVSEIGKVYA